jgi:hypothetical protein
MSLYMYYYNIKFQIYPWMQYLYHINLRHL